MVDNKNIYEQTTQGGIPYGKITPSEATRFKDTVRQIESLLDVGCFSRERLNYVPPKHLGIDVAG